MKTARIVARIRVRAAQLKKNEMWKTLTYGPKRLVCCSCGGCVEDIPQTGEYKGEGCTHVVALYEGRVTEDKRHAIEEIAFGDRAQLRGGPWLVQLSKTGRELFEWRWAVKKLASSSADAPPTK